ncbi:type II toxin-antitoxin system Phd/YefM family antitoxin [Tepidimonas taiwanensis]|uniref:Antitoxin n=1 Tax=Tepidimonas taiwanensis TaxID=307486 RepID=A0A554XAS9_9BURK|nr:type II toxin-antitoxin system Phd/YefM family antitoxin [Tepidimonas taiwanensis]MCX7672919.1 type II toxin-antitoxin system Phd/YefM family antitoxin [Thiobacillaceae bacterium]TSE32941.1 prevent-host-death family protein [Tepidimonas taiwanensis]UBQ04525.1 type II toxin-antitoxin system Phd/YefM family antitoxin [Tepidimonas taiwanensis]
MQTWQMQQAKARLSELVKCAREQPQAITVHGEPVAIVVSRETFERLAQASESLLDFMRRSPLYGEEDIAFARDPSRTREVVL